MPTKATLFGLDLRFRKVDQKLLEEKEKKNASKVIIGRSKDGFNRHHIPVDPLTISLTKLEKRQVGLRRSLQPVYKDTAENSCFESLVKERKYNIMPKNISFRKPNDSPDVKPLNEEELLKQHQKKLEKSNVDALISKTKGELVGI